MAATASVGSFLTERLPAANEVAEVAPERERGWLLPSLLRTDALLYGRWDYLAECWEHGALPAAPLPRLPFLSAPDKATWQMLTACLDAIPQHGQGGWVGWSGPEYFRFLMEWLLHGFGHAGHQERPAEPSSGRGAHERLQRTFDLPLLQNHPYDYWGDLLAQNAYGKRQGFFATPHTIAEFMAQMMFGGSDAESDAEGRKTDTRRLTVCDPCVGTGRMLLHASNHSLRLYGMDIDPTLCLATLVNGYLFAPWLVRPLPFLDRVQYQPECSGDVSDAMAAQAPPHQAATLADTEHDAPEQWRFEPVKKRRSKGSGADEAQQGVLF